MMMSDDDASIVVLSRDPTIPYEDKQEREIHNAVARSQK